MQLPLAGVQSEAFSSKWQGNFSIDSNGHYKIIRHDLNVSLKASLKSVIAEMDSFGAVENGASSALALVAHTQCTRVAGAASTEGTCFEQKIPLISKKVRAATRAKEERPKDRDSPAPLLVSSEIEGDKGRWMAY